MWSGEVFFYICFFIIIIIVLSFFCCQPLTWFSEQGSLKQRVSGLQYYRVQAVTALFKDQVALSGCKQIANQKERVRCKLYRVTDCCGIPS